MEVVFDTQTITDAGFDKYLTRTLTGLEASTLTSTNSYTDPNSLVGGTIGANGVIYLGSKQVRLDGKNKRIVINDGKTDRVIIGYLD